MDANIKYVLLYLLIGTILSVAMYMTSKHPLPICREIKSHTIIILFWPIILLNIGRIMINRINED